MKKKILIISSILLIFLALFMFDYIRSLQFNINVASVSPSPAAADGQSPVDITLKLTDKGGKPVGRHSLFIFSLGGGMFKANREFTDNQGQALFTYYPYQTSELMPVKDVPIKVIDESNSVFIEINTARIFAVKLKEPPEKNADSDITNSIFGD